MGKLQSIENEKIYFSHPTIEEDSKNQKTLIISSSFEKILRNMKKIVFFGHFFKL
jgi:hypothetical protein